MSLKAFTEHYQNWGKRKKYNFSKAKAKKIYATSNEFLPLLSKENLTKMIVRQAIEQLNTTSKIMEEHQRI